MISRYNSFLENKILESLINESIVYFSPPLRRIITTIFNDNDQPIAADLLKIEGDDIKQDITFLNLDTEGYLSFITMRNAMAMIKSKFGSIDVDSTSNKTLADAIWDNDDQNQDNGIGVYKNARNQIKIGKLINKFFPDKYTDKQIEDFVNIFKASLEKIGEKFEMVEGDDINFWYNSDNYLEHKGTLGSSCMKSATGIFNIYVKNPEVCKLLILKEDDKLIGRAIIWKLNSIIKENSYGDDLPKITDEGFYFMDRQYTSRGSDVEKFKSYAKSKKWFYKTHNNHHSFSSVSYNNSDMNVSMTIKVNPYKEGTYDYRKYPYLDTFRRYNPETGILYNDENEDEKGNYILEDTGGSYREIESGVYSEWYDRMISEDEAVWSEPLGDHILIERSNEVVRGSRGNIGLYPDDYEDIVYDEYKGDYIHKDDSVYSDMEDSYIFDDDAVNVVTDISRNGEINDDEGWMHKNNKNITSLSPLGKQTWYKKLSEIDSDWDTHSYILKELLLKNYEDNWIPKKFSTIVFKVAEPIDETSVVDITGIEYLCAADAIALGYKLGNDERIVDKFSYTENISKLLPTIKKKLEFEVRKVIQQLAFPTAGKQLSIEVGDEEVYKVKLNLRKKMLINRLDEVEGDRYI